MSDTQNYGYVSGTNSYSNSVSEFPVPLMADGVSLIGYFDANGKELKKGDALGRYYINFEENRTLYAKYAFTEDVSFAERLMRRSSFLLNMIGIIKSIKAKSKCNLRLTP